MTTRPTHKDCETCHKRFGIARRGVIPKICGKCRQERSQRAAEAYRARALESGRTEELAEIRRLQAEQRAKDLTERMNGLKKISPEARAERLKSIMESRNYGGQS